MAMAMVRYWGVIRVSGAKVDLGAAAVELVACAGMEAEATAPAEKDLVVVVKVVVASVAAKVVADRVKVVATEKAVVVRVKVVATEKAVVERAAAARVDLEAPATGMEAGAQWMAAVPLAGQAAEVMAAKLETVAAAVAAELRQ